MPWTALIGAALRTSQTRRIARLSDTAYWSRNTAAIQATQLRGLLRRATDTEFGRQHGFRRILCEPDRTLADAYRAQVPVRDYSGFRDWFTRMRDTGEPDVTWPDTVKNWAQTSGTTSGDKYMPVSPGLLAHNRKASFDIFAHAARAGLSVPGLFAGKLLFLGGSTELDTNAAGIQTGDLSGIVTPLIRWPLTEVYQPGRDIALMAHWPTKIDAMAEACLDQDIRGVFGMASWGLVLFQKVIELARQRDPGVRSLSDVWPNLRLFVHGGVKYAPFQPRVAEVWSGSAATDIPHRLEVYPASEAFVAMQDTPGDPGLRLCADHGVYFEFVPVERINDPAPEAFGAHEVEPGQRYVVVLTTPAGLWRYILGDVVEFDTIPTGGAGGGPARLRIVGRHRHFINAFGENIIVENIENAVVDASAQTGARTGEFTAGPVYPGNGRRAGLELVIEWDSPAELAEPFAAVFDQAVKKYSVDYGIKRTDDLGMGPPTITTVPMGTIHRWMESRGKLGGQHKCPRCANHRDYIEGILSTIADHPQRQTHTDRGRRSPKRNHTHDHRR